MSLNSFLDSVAYHADDFQIFTVIIAEGDKAQATWNTDEGQNKTPGYGHSAYFSPWDVLCFCFALPAVGSVAVVVVPVVDENDGGWGRDDLIWVGGWLAIELRIGRARVDHTSFYQLYYNRLKNNLNRKSFG